MKTIISLLLTGSILTLAGPWQIEDDYYVRFDTSGAEGTFRGLNGEIYFDPAAPDQASMDVSVDVKTIATGNETKDKHARGESWFNAATYPTIRFVANRFRATTTGYEVTGLLTLHGTTKKVTFPFTFNPTDTGGIFEGRFEVDRKDYGIKGNFFGWAVGRNVEVELRVPVSQ